MRSQHILFDILFPQSTSASTSLRTQAEPLGETMVGSEGGEQMGATRVTTDGRGASMASSLMSFLRSLLPHKPILMAANKINSEKKNKEQVLTM